MRAKHIELGKRQAEQLWQKYEKPLDAILREEHNRKTGGSGGGGELYSANRISIILRTIIYDLDFRNPITGEQYGRNSRIEAQKELFYIMDNLENLMMDVPAAYKNILRGFKEDLTNNNLNARINVPYTPGRHHVPDIDLSLGLGEAPRRDIEAHYHSGPSHGAVAGGARSAVIHGHSSTSAPTVHQHRSQAGASSAPQRPPSAASEAPTTIPHRHTGEDIKAAHSSRTKLALGAIRGDQTERLRTKLTNMKDSQSFQGWHAAIDEIAAHPDAHEAVKLFEHAIKQLSNSEVWRTPHRKEQIMERLLNECEAKASQAQSHRHPGSK